MPNTINKIVFTMEAGTEFRASVEWYESKINGIGLIFTKEVDSAIERIKLNPTLIPENN